MEVQLRKIVRLIYGGSTSIENFCGNGFDREITQIRKVPR